ncbi:MAG: sodium/proton-translocating pyrophosphatase, partial [Clostridia bacterium]|nr:sodium/proton-translocating pyrophosphatase [Clostridia bacterium]
MMSLVIIAALFALAYVAYNYLNVKKLDEGTEKMQQIASAIRIGANAFINYEYKVIALVAAIIIVLICILISWQSAVSFLIGALMSACAGYIGMKVATYANVRVTNRARETKSLGETLRVAFRGGSVMGLSVAGFALLGIFIVYIVFGKMLGQLSIEAINSSRPNWLGIDANFTMTLSCYALGCSTIAMFNRIGGGIYTKAADMGADLVGKTEAGIPEDDPRNPATIADNVGDNVGDVAGLGSDLLESFVGAILAASILSVHLFLTAQFKGYTISDAQLVRVLSYPILFAALGLIACVLGVASLVHKKNISEHPHNELNFATWISAGLTLVFGIVLSLVLFRKDAMLMEAFGFKAGWISPLVSAGAGIVSGIVIGMLAEYYTSYDYDPTRRIAQASKEGPALTITQGLAVGMRSCMLPLIVLCAALVVAYAVCGLYG